jgi:hypothetical protein
MPRPPQFLFDFKRTIQFVLSQIGGVSHGEFVRLYDFDDFLEGEALECHSPRKLAIAFAARFLADVRPAYRRALSLALVRFLARQSGRAVDESDNEAIKALSEIDTDDVNQLEKWLDAYYRDVV